MGGDFLETSRPVMEWVARTTWEASLIAALVLLAQWVLRGRVSARWRYNLWLLVVARLLLPAVPGTHYSPFNLVQIPAPKQQAPAVPKARPRLVPAPPLRATPVPAEPGDTGRLYLASDVERPRLPELVAPLPEEPAVAVLVAPAVTVETSQPVQTPPWAMAGLPTGEPAADHGRAAERMTPVPAQRLSTRAPAREPVRVPAAPVMVPWFQRVNWFAVAAITWVAGVAFVLTRLTWVTLRLMLAVRRLPPVQDPLVRALLAECAAQLRVRRLPRVLEAPDHFGPALVGLLRPCVVLPACVLRGAFDRQELRLILTHELAHMKRRDVAANWVLAVLGALHWFNPVLWLTFRRMRADREMACDELVLSVNGRDAGRAYGPTILKLLQTLSRGSALPGMVGVLEGKTSIRRRFAMIARFDRHKNDAAPVLGVVLSLLIGGVALTGAVRGQESPADQPREISVDLAETEARDEPSAGAEATAEANTEATAQATAEAAAEGDDAAGQARESREAARQQAEAARERVQELQSAAAERQDAIREAQAEAERAVVEARQQVDEQRAASEEAMQAARQVMQEARAQGQQHVAEARAALQEAKQAVQGQNGDGAAEAAAAVVERELELNQAVNESQQALREAQESIEQAPRERDGALGEANNAVDEARAEHQAAIRETARAAQEVMAEQHAAPPGQPAAAGAPADPLGGRGAANAPGAGHPGMPGPAVAGGRGGARAYPGYPGRGGAQAYPGYPGRGYPGYPGGRGAMYPGMGGAAGAPGMGVPAAESSVEDPAARQADARATNALRTNVPISVDGVPLQEALAHVSDATGVDIVPDWKGLAQVDVRQDTPVSLQLRQGAAAEQVLSWLLRSAGGDAAGFALDHGAIIIAPRERLERLVVTRAYNLGDLAEQGRQLEALVRDTVAPNSWRENGGVGAVRFFNNRLFVTATEPNHRQVERLLGLMDAQGVRPGAAPGAAMPGLPGMGAPQAQPGGAPGVQPPGPSRRPLGLQPRR